MTGTGVSLTIVLANDHPITGTATAARPSGVAWRPGRRSSSRGRSRTFAMTNRLSQQLATRRRSAGRALPDDVRRRLVLPEAEEPRVAELPARRPLGEADLGDQARL